MTKLLVSVRTSEEALEALAAGADIIDLKDPAQGALGALPASVIDEIVHLVNGRLPISATIGDLPMDAESVMFAIEHTSKIGVDIIKAGFFGASEAHDKWVKVLQSYTAGVRLVAVLFADQMPDFAVLPKLKQAGFYGVMLDTASKSGKCLGDYVSMQRLREFLQTARQYELETGFAGSLRLADIPMLASLSPGYLGFRGGLCEQHIRTGRLLQSSTMEAKKLLRESNTICEYAGWA